MYVYPTVTNKTVKKVVGDFTEKQFNEFLKEVELMCNLRPHGNYNNNNNNNNNNKKKNIIVE